MNKIFALTDYKGFFGSKYRATPYRSGLNQTELKTLFREHGYDLEFVPMADTFLIGNVKDIPVIYTSSEDIGFHYKAYIEDVVLHLKLRGAYLIPEYHFLRANNNKSFMELMRTHFNKQDKITLNGWSFGSMEEMLSRKQEFTYPVVIKSSAGAMGKGVYLAKDEKELFNYAKKLSHTPHFKTDIRDRIRSKKHKNYTPESLYRNKFIVQQFIPNLVNDWKVYAFGDKYYVFYRPIFKYRKFKASGGGYENYFYGSEAMIPDGLLDYAKHAFELFPVPHASLDVAFDGKNFYLLEFQFIYFGTAGILYSKEYFVNEQGNWLAKQNGYTQESIYTESILAFLKNR
ncbi:MAG: hypothetical protein K0B37_14835 [Bacteroidales bacterium]|nr:hypothetical protein [Bacteroidales bacterium]